jgi:gamma-glutamyltranspeptidase/glutathione hydrolase
MDLDDPEDQRRASGRRGALTRRVIVPLATIVTLTLGALLLATGPRDPMPFEDPTGRPREALAAQEFIVVAGTPWAAKAMEDVLDAGGNAIDAAIAGLLVLGVTFGEASSFPGIAPVLVWDAKKSQALSYIGVGKAPERATIEAFAARGHEFVPIHDVIAQLVPASPDVITELLTTLGTRGFAELARPAIEIAEEGFPIHASGGAPFRLAIDSGAPISPAPCGDSRVSKRTAAPSAAAGSSASARCATTSIAGRSQRRSSPCRSRKTAS